MKSKDHPPWFLPSIHAAVESTHWTAPSPTVYSETLFVVQRQSSVGLIPHFVKAKLKSKNDVKQGSAHDGRRFVSSGERVVFAAPAWMAYSSTKTTPDLNAIIKEAVVIVSDCPGDYLDSRHPAISQLQETPLDSVSFFHILETNFIQPQNQNNSCTYLWKQILNSKKRPASQHHYKTRNNTRELSQIPINVWDLFSKSVSVLAVLFLFFHETKENNGWGKKDDDPKSNPRRSNGKRWKEGGVAKKQ